MIAAQSAAHEAYVDAVKAGVKPEQADKVYQNVLENSDAYKNAQSDFDKNSLSGKLASGKIDLKNLPKSGKPASEGNIEKLLGKPSSPVPKKSPADLMK
jgi:3-hydroxyisobutyrate dehydrogenase-like beta-hydroxyacid dehydrogenase